MPGIPPPFAPASSIFPPQICRRPTSAPLPSPLLVMASSPPLFPAPGAQGAISPSSVPVSPRVSQQRLDPSKRKEQRHRRRPQPLNPRQALMTHEKKAAAAAAADTVVSATSVDPARTGTSRCVAVNVAPKSGRAGERGRGGQKKAKVPTEPPPIDLEFSVDPNINKTTYCFCNQDCYGEMVACDNPEVIHLATHWIHLWSHLLPLEQRKHMVTGCNRLMTVAQAFYTQVG